MTLKALKVARAHQGPGDTGRRDLEVIFTRDGILDIEDCSKRAADRCAIIHRDGAVGTFGHDLEGLGRGPHQADLHQIKPKIGQHRLDNISDLFFQVYSVLVTS